MNTNNRERTLIIAITIIATTGILFTALKTEKTTIYQDKTTKVMLNGTQTGKTTVINTTKTINQQENVNLCNAVTQLGPSAQEWISNKSIECEVAGGNWVCQQDKLGCYNIPSGAWDPATGCYVDSAINFAKACHTLGAKATCMPDEVSCEYREGEHQWY